MVKWFLPDGNHNLRLHRPTLINNSERGPWALGSVSFHNYTIMLTAMIKFAQSHKSFRIMPTLESLESLERPWQLHYSSNYTTTK